jgi:predicted phosphodiesterase
MLSDLINLNNESAAGRFCPPDYRINPELLKPSLSPLTFEVVYVVGGLYGNTEALTLICDAFEAETSLRKTLVFNGDFHWFDIARDEFLEVEAKTSKYLRLRGNVETELARHVEESMEADIGCGCAYPAEVSDKEVDYSNAIIQKLRATYRSCTAELHGKLSDLPMVKRLDVDGLGVGITHGDIDSLAGWSLAHNKIASTLAEGLAKKMNALELDIVASSHTCLPALHKQNSLVVVNNGAAGLSNFSGQTSGLITRIAKQDAGASRLPIAFQSSLAGKTNAVSVQALSVDFDNAKWQAKFLSQWPAQTAAHESYWQRIRLGTSYTKNQAMQYER